MLGQDRREGSRELEKGWPATVFCGAFLRLVPSTLGTLNCLSEQLVPVSTPYIVEGVPIANQRRHHRWGPQLVDLSQARQGDCQATASRACWCGLSTPPTEYIHRKQGISFGTAHLAMGQNIPCAMWGEEHIIGVKAPNMTDSNKGKKKHRMASIFFDGCPPRAIWVQRPSKVTLVTA